MVTALVKASVPKLGTGSAVPPETAAPAEAAPANQAPSTSNASVRGAKTAAVMPAAEPAPLDPELAEALSAPPLPQYDVSMSLEARPLDDLKIAPDAAAAPLETGRSHDGFSMKTASLFFGSSSLGASVENIERWQPGEEPTIVMPGAAADPDMKARLSDLGNVPVLMASAGFGKFLAEETEKWGKVIRTANIKAE